jgi:probable 2-oxoglutarate dehydrogenase E1 component DHKTD1
LQNRAENAPLLRYVDSVRTHGHRAARIDPLDLLQRVEVAALDPARYGLDDPNKKYNVDGIIWNENEAPYLSSFGESCDAKHESQWWSLEEITSHLRATYVDRIAYEYMHSPSKTERLWFSHLLESPATPTSPDVPKEQKLRTFELLSRSEAFDNFLQAKFPNLKRYGLEGGESMLPALDTLFQAAADGTIGYYYIASNCSLNV